MSHREIHRENGDTRPLGMGAPKNNQPHIHLISRGYWSPYPLLKGSNTKVKQFKQLRGPGPSQGVEISAPFSQRVLI